MPSDLELAVRFSSIFMVTHNQRLGWLGEDAAADWYVHHGFDVVERNWHGDAGELDLIVVRFVRRRPELVVFAEVKTRSSSRFGAGVLAVGQAKQDKIRRTASQWLSEQRARIPHVRFDVVDADSRGNLQVYEAAF